jgi:hypothetical protein
MPAGEDLGEPSDVVGQCLQVGAGRQRGGEARVVFVGEVVRVPQDPAVDLRGFGVGAGTGSRVRFRVVRLRSGFRQPRTDAAVPW